ncbi:30S ribosomal protein S17e [Methanofollis fontis]|uniref:Small ribosomal subunit protein eS17 n=1 Tax=Methanofollis fontis TaxID=2052832 RepID=A0A483CR47_9EURY|nr:30S ribosomal protein S17e [Methanofollis fontis]TAJ44651.1 30S ribosomal protein S17e [Methanofollis fontis]
MGIKPTYIKSLGEELMAKNAGRFTGDFTENKQVVAEVAIIDSKRVLNRVAGYITRKQNTKKPSV